MRFTAAIISASALASIGVQSAPSPQEVSAEKWGGQSLPEPARTCKCEPPKTPTPRPPSPPPQRKCVDYCVFYNWDLSQNTGGPTQPKDLDGCAKDSANFHPDSDAAVFYNGFCYIKNTKDVTSQNFYYSHGRQLIIQGKCEDLKKNYKCKLA
ncbi:hypothetical protein QFC20_004887 [Naganishia adeliensis]|uniref:Uncharacterized protein n=1 Tax=Naganishia adeliensis TaxID=92952 RepID=A0ACC2VUV5_9TREE|nr:hypothetical protein QFC20_004887 [Naganishia adeliensis]